MSEGPDEILMKAVDSARNVKFGRGVVSKTSFVAALVPALWLTIALRLTGSLVADGALMTAGIVATVFAVWYVRASHSFAEKNPAQALLEGAEFLEYTRIGAATREVPKADDMQPTGELTSGRLLPK